MNKDILNTGIQNFIKKNISADISSLTLKGSPFLNISTIELAEQIEAKKKCKNKLPTWFKTQNIYYPNKVNIEQTSSELTAQYKANLVSGNSLIDLTGGYGVDSYYFSKKIHEITYCEINENLSKIAVYNYEILEVKNIKTINKNGIDYLTENDKKYDWIYIDPSRRDHAKNKVFILNDCLPNIPENLDQIFKHSANILIKTSPLLDLKKGINELKFVKEIHIVAINNDVKELLWVLKKNYDDNIKIKTINIKNIENELFDFILKNESEAQANFSLPQKYLYEPNSAILKAGAFNLISKKQKINKLHQHSHLYTSDILIDFPGRSFKINKVIPYSRKSLKNEIKLNKANITIRNFPETVAQIRKKAGIKEGGDEYLFFTTNINNHKFIIRCSKINSSN